MIPTLAIQNYKIKHQLFHIMRQDSHLEQIKLICVKTLRIDIHF